jgi:hypothetical protein
MAKQKITPIRPPAPEASFIRGIRSCVAMLESTSDAEEFHTQSTFRRRAPQNNAVRRALAEVLERGDERELEGFCALITEICAIADQHGEWSSYFADYADRRERVLRRRHRSRLAHG